jgi:nitrate reductase gamma subunit
MIETFLFGVFPYLALVFAVGGGIYRYVKDPFSYSSLSSELLEKRWLFWGSVAWHFGIIPVLLAHLAAGLFPAQAAAVHANGLATFFLETIGLALGILAAFGVLILAVRRVVRPEAAAVTTPMDALVLAALAVQVTAGVVLSVRYRWGSIWYLDTASPWFWSLVRLKPDFSAIHPLPGLVRFHMFNGFVIIALFPVSRLVHLVSVPVSYLWRPFQVVIWNRRRRPDRS